MVTGLGMEGGVRAKSDLHRCSECHEGGPPRIAALSPPAVGRPRRRQRYSSAVLPSAESSVRSRCDLAPGPVGVAPNYRTRPRRCSAMVLADLALSSAVAGT